MTDPGVEDSPVGWVNRHIRAYVASDGEKGHEWRRGVPTLLLTTTGRRTGTKHRTALIYGRDGADYVVVASKGGARTNPAWYLNLSADPDVDVQVGAEKFRGVARTAQGERRAPIVGGDESDLAGLRGLPAEDGARDPGRRDHSSVRCRQ